MGLGRHDTCALFRSGDQPIHGGRKLFHRVMSFHVCWRSVIYIDMEHKVSM